MRICFFSGDITRSGGTERVSSQIANGLAADGAYEILFLSLVEQEKECFFYLDPAIPRYTLGDRWIRPGPGYLPLIGKLRKFLKEKKIDVIIDIDIVLDVLSLPAAKGLGTKVISWEHFNADYELSVGYRKWILRYSVKRSHQIVVLTKADLENYREKLGRKERIRQIYNPLSPMGDKPDGERKQQIISVGRLVPQKGIDKLMEVALAVLTAHPDWQWILLGEGEEREKLERFIREHQLQERLILTGNVSNVNDYLREASLFVTTSVFEGLGMNILEAKRMGLPCVSFDIIGPQELIRDGIDGYLIPQFHCDKMIDKISTLIRDPALRARFASHGRGSLQEFAPEAVIKQWKEMIGHL